MKTATLPEWLALHANAARKHGFDYEESKLSAEEFAHAAVMIPARVEQYRRGILTGGEFDCVYRNGVMPVRLA